MMRDRITTGVEAAGLALITVGSFVQFGPGFGLIVAGVAAVIAGIAEGSK